MGRTLMVIALAGASLAGAYWYGGRVADTAWQARWDEQVAIMERERADALQRTRAEEQRRQSAIDEVRTDAQRKIEQAQADAAAAGAAADRLRAQAQRLAQRANQCASSAGATAGGQAAASPSVVLADVLGRADQRAGELAAAYDRARAAGLACERAYDAVRGKAESVK